MKSIKILPQKIHFALLFIINVHCLLAKTAAAEIAKESIIVDFNIFADNILQEIVTGYPKNVIVSPLSIQICLALVFFGTEGRTAEELRAVIKLGHHGRLIIAGKFEEFMQTAFNNPNEGIKMHMANRIYVGTGLKIKADFNKLAKKAFKSKAQRINFTDARAAANKINSFVRKQTKYNIREVIDEGSIDKNAKIAFVNAIYFQGKWKIPFDPLKTTKSTFNIDKTRKVMADTMYMEEDVRYGEFVDLDAKVLELYYGKSNLSMIFFLPNTVDGLEDMEQKLAGKDLNEISSKLKTEKVKIYIPKFRIESELDLKEPLQALGLVTMFTNKCDFRALLEKNIKHGVSLVKHKAFIEVNEAGTEAAAVSMSLLVTTIGMLEEKMFKADHPFTFAIRDTEAVYFAGHVLRF